MRFALNDHLVETDAPAGLPALDYLRREAGLTGVKFACREGDCGSCAVLIGERRTHCITYQVVTSCLVPLGALAGRHVVTIEGLNRNSLTVFQEGLVAQGGSQCGFCTPGFVVSLTGHLLEAETWDRRGAVESVAGNICRCTGYASIVRAIDDLVERLRRRVDPAEERIPALVREKILPDYFLNVEELVPTAAKQVSGPPAREQIVVGGGTDLYVQQPDELEAASIFLVPISPSTATWVDGGRVYLAGGATAEDMKRSPILSEKVPGIDRAMELMGSLPIRNRASIAGNLVNASPIGDMTISLLALNAEIGLACGADHRVLPLHEFFLGYKELDLRPAELVEWVRFADRGPDLLFNFEKVSKRTHLDIASVNSSISLVMAEGRMTQVHLSAGGVAPIPRKLHRTMAVLENAAPTLEVASAAAEAARAEVSPITDVRGSAEYKRLLLGQLVLAHFNQLFQIEPEIFAEVAP